MKLTLISLFAVVLFSCEKKSETYVESDLKIFTDTSSIERKLSSLSISLNPSGGAPHHALFHDSGTLVGNPSYRTLDGAPMDVAVELTQRELEELRVIINEAYRFSNIESFVGTRSPDTSIKAPDLPKIEVMLARKQQYALQIRSGSIYKDAFYIDEFASIAEESHADGFLQKLQTRIRNKKANDALQQLINRH